MDYKEHSRAMAERIGERVRASRKSREFSQNELAARAGILRPNVSRLERGSHLPSLPTLVRVAWALGVTLSYLVEGGEPC
jgi:transcriptional regulator with XRE-family HTH domain